MAGEESKSLSKPDSLSQKLLAAVGAAVELKVVTQVGDAAIATSINLVQGDITNVVPEKFWAPDQQIIREFHQAQVEQAKSIVERNLRLIGEFGKQVAEAITELKKAERS
jgi:hypothetical protein